MIPVLSAEQTRQADAYTIENEPIASIDLMERASRAFVKKFTELSERGHRIYVFCGIGNNGGDGLAISRLLKEQGYEIQVYIVGNPEKGSNDFKINLERLSNLISYTQILTREHLPQLNQTDYVVDALFGSGLSRSLEGIYAQVVSHINNADTSVFSVDIASGLFTDQHIVEKTIIQPTHTISFQCPKPAFFHPSLQLFVGQWHVVDIGLDKKYIHSLPVNQYFSEQHDFKSLLPKKSVFDHKGDAGKIKLITGSKGKIGAAVLCTRAALRTGSGLVFTQVPGCGRDVLQISVPEAMVIEDKNFEMISAIDETTFDAIGIGPGIGTHPDTAKALEKLVSNSEGPLVIDADGLNILSQNKSLLKKVPANSILTPHPGEFKRLVGEWTDDYHKIELLQNFAQAYKFNVVLKGAYSIVCSSDGDCYYNCSGNPGMATGGSGDVLTGVIVSLFGQTKAPFIALRLGVFLHGLAGDLAAEKIGANGMIASDIVEYLPHAIKKIQF